MSILRLASEQVRRSSLWRSVRRLPAIRYLEVLLLLGLLLYPAVQRDAFQVDLVGKLFSFALLGIALDLVWGYTGLLSLGHAAFFGWGGYMIGFVTVRGIWLLPKSIWLGLLLSVAVPTIAAVLLAGFLFSGRRAIGGAYFAIATLAVSYLSEQGAIAWEPVLGGFNGIPNIPSYQVILSSAHNLRLWSGIPFYYLAGGVLVGVYLLLRRWVDSRFGLVMRAVRDNEDRLPFLGYSTIRVKSIVFIVSAAIAGLGGGLYVLHEGYVSPPLLGFGLSTQAVLWVAIGGPGSLLGAIVGSLLVNYLTSALSGAFLTLWMLILGVALVVVILKFPAGLVGATLAWLEQRRGARSRLEWEHNGGKHSGHD